MKTDVDVQVGHVRQLSIDVTLAAIVLRRSCLWTRGLEFESRRPIAENDRDLQGWHERVLRTTSTVGDDPEHRRFVA